MPAVLEGRRGHDSGPELSVGHVGVDRPDFHLGKMPPVQVGNLMVNLIAVTQFAAAKAPL